MSPTPDTWPELRYDDYRETRDTLHMYAQIVGKIRLGLKPPLAQWGHAPLALGADGFTTGPLWVGDGVLSVSLDLLRHEARLQRSDGRRRTVPLGGAVADFYARLMAALAELDVDIAINRMPQEVATPIAFDRDATHATYEPQMATRLWQAFLRVASVYERFQSGYWGKQAGPGLYWGGFDLTVTRFSGRDVTPPQGLPQIMTGALDAESMSVTFVTGGAESPAPGFMASAFPPPPGLSAAPLQPPQAQFVQHPSMGGLFVLSYDDVRASADPGETLLQFCRSVYETVATLGGWDRGRLERRPPHIRQAA
jgi:Family of unknown function (DUF5996)